MKRKCLKCVCALFLVLALFGGKAWAILGIGDIVFDPSNYAQAIEQLLELQRQYRQMVETYEVLRSQYNHMQRMAQRVPVNMGSRYRATHTPWQRSGASDTYGGAGAWVNAINSGLDVTNSYSRAAQSLATYGSSFNDIPPDHLDRIKTSFATVELTDGSNRHGIETVGRLRANAAQVENAIQGLEDDSLSASPDMNTEIGVLNKTNAASLIALRASQDTNRLLVALTESQIVSAKRTRDAESQALNNHIRFVKEGRAVMATQAANASEALRTWRMP